MLVDGLNREDARASPQYLRVKRGTRQIVSIILLRRTESALRLKPCI